MLEGIKVIELGTHVAIPNATRLLADWGAEVIKVEPPRGEAWRVIGNSYGFPYSPDCNPVFQTPNANKKGIALNLKEPKGRELMMELLQDADIFMTNTRMNGLKKLGLDYDSLKDRFPKLIYIHFTGYGPDGPEKDRPGFDVTAYWAKAGMPLEWSLNEAQPFRPLPGFGDATVGFINLSAALAALWNREKTGQGEFVRTSLFSGALWFNNCGILSAQFQPEKYPRSRYEQPTPYHLTYQTKDEDYFFFSATNWDNMYDKLLAKLGMEEYIGDARFATLAEARKHLDVLAPLLDEAFVKMTTQEVSDVFNELDVVFQVVLNPKDLVKDEQAWVNGYLFETAMEDGRKVVLPAPPIKFTNAATHEFRLAPQLGEHTAEILQKLGHSPEEIKQLQQERVIVSQ